MPIEIASGSLVIRSWKKSDAGALGRAVAENLDHIRPWLPWARSLPDDPGEVLEVVNRWIVEATAKPDEVVGLFIDGEVVGGSGLHPRIGSLALRLCRVAQGHLDAWNPFEMLGYDSFALPYTFPSLFTLIAYLGGASRLYVIAGYDVIALLGLAGIAAYVKTQPEPHRVLVGRDPRFLGHVRSVDRPGDEFVCPRALSGFRGVGGQIPIAGCGGPSCLGVQVARAHQFDAVRGSCQNLPNAELGLVQLRFRITHRALQQLGDFLVLEAVRSRMEAPISQPFG